MHEEHYENLHIELDGLKMKVEAAVQKDIMKDGDNTQDIEAKKPEETKNLFRILVS